MPKVIHTIKNRFNKTKYNISQTRSRLSPSLRVKRSSTSSRCPADGLRNITFGLSKTKYCILYMVGFMTFGLFVSLIIPVYIIEDKTEAAVGTTTQSTISLSLSSNNIALNLLQPGTYDTNNLESGIFGSASTTASVSTTNYTGYTLSIAASSNVNAGKLVDSTNSDTTKNYFSSIESATPESVFSNSSNTNYNGKWGYKPSYYNSSANSNYLPAPSTTGVTIEQTTAPNTTAKDYTITLGARANINQSAGSYSNTFNIIATANPVTYAITYADNSGDSTVANLPSAQASDLTTQGKVNTSVITLSSTTPTRTGYTFNKWCLGTVSNSGTTCTGTEYSAGADFGIDQTTNNQNITLYATWSIKTNLSLIINFDTGVSSVAVKSGSTTGTTIGTVSTSGGSVSGLTYKTTYYLVPTYASGKKFSSWTQNNVGTGGSGLSSTSAETPSFNIGDGTNSVTLTSESDVPTMQDYTMSQCKNEASSTDVTLADARDGKTYTVRYINDACWMTQNLAFIGAPTDPTGQMTLNTATSNIDTDKVLAYGDLTAGNSYDEPRLHVPNSTNDSAALALYTVEQLGAWYNFAAASIGSIVGSSTQVTPAYDICPKNWHLPLSYTGAGSMNNIISYKDAFQPIHGGSYSGGSLGSSASNGGYWWSASYSGTTRRQLLQYYGTTLSLFMGDRYNGLDRYYGFYVRCVRADNRMQDMTSDLLAELMPDMESSATLVDIRDERIYSVAKLKDGKYWMTKNLGLSGATTLTSADTNFTDTYVSNLGSVSGLSINTTNKTITLPNSSSGGFSNDSTAYVYVSGCTYDTDYCGYYSWPATTLGGKTESGTAVTGNGEDAPYSICPKGWKLPTSGNQSDTSATSTTGYKKGDFYKLAIQYGMSSSNYYQSTSNFYNQASPGTTANFLLGGYYISGSPYDVGSRGYYWSASSASSSGAYDLYFNSGYVDSAYYDNRRFGFSVRCVFGS